jgi:hypothetical protein
MSLFVVAITIETMAAPAAAEDMPCMVTTMMPLMMPFIQGLLFGMLLLISQATQTLPEAFYCPIICKLISDPFITPDGITYEYEAATEWIHVQRGQSPLNENPLLLSHFHDSNTLYELIQIP